MKNQVMGIDISKDKIDFCLLDTLNHEVVKRGTITNTRKELIKWLNMLDHNHITFAMEHTGHYGAMLCWVLSEKGAIFYLINPLELKKSLGIQRGKTDSIDAYRIANYTFINKHTLRPVELPCKELRKLKALITARQQFVKISVQLQNSIKANIILNKTIDIKGLIKRQKAQLAFTKKTLESIEQEMQEIIKSSKELSKSYEKVTKVIGIGPMTAIKCIAATDNFIKFSNARKFSCHCGLAPFPYQSGSSVKGRNRTHYLKEASLKGVLFKAAISAIQHDPQLKKYYARKLNEGKHKLSVLNAVANKLVLRIFAVAKRNESFVKLSA